MTNWTHGSYALITQEVLTVRVLIHRHRSEGAAKAACEKYDNRVNGWCTGRSKPFIASGYFVEKGAKFEARELRPEHQGAGRLPRAARVEVL